MQTDEKHFLVSSNITNVLLYIEDMGPVTFYGQDDKGHHTSYTITQGPPT